ncbi:MAG: hypothetical protein M3Q33_02610 [Acidobacteriota bacterium]|nr:hypothetical protein [Acidobacteriota bacterium]
MLLSEELKISFHPINEEGIYWWTIFTHILEEFVLRGYKPPEPIGKRFEEIQIPKYDLEGLPNAVESFKKMSLIQGQFLLKYGKYKYLQSCLEEGKIRIMPASSYDDPSLNHAIRDAELEIKFSGIPSEIKMEVFDGKTGQPKGFITPTGNLNYTLKSRTSYYVYCLANKYSLRMYGDFEADCCLVIKDPDKFIQKLIKVFSSQLTDYKVIVNDCNYFDPLNARADNLDVYFSKHFRFSYQKEFRIIWLPPKPAAKLEPVFLELGNLAEFCEIIRLKE